MTIDYLEQAWEQFVYKISNYNRRARPLGLAHPLSRVRLRAKVSRIQGSSGNH